MTIAPNSTTQTAPPTSYSLQQYQNPIKDQTERGVCWAFGGVAAIEGFYRRVYGLTLDLSENYAVHYEHTQHVDPYYLQLIPNSEDNSSWLRNSEDNSSWYDNMGNSETVLRDSKVGRLPETAFAPYMSAAQQDALSQALLGIPRSSFNFDSNPTQEQIDTLDFAPEHIPPEARLHASYGVDGYASLPYSSNLTDDLENAIYANHEVVADFDMKLVWEPNRKMWQWDANADGGGHVMLIVGYDRAAGYFTVRNSMGTQRPREWQWMPISYDAMRYAYQDGYYITSVRPPPASPQLEAAWLDEWVIGFEGRLMVRRFGNNDTQGRVKIGDFYSFSDGARHDVEGSISANGTMSFFIGPANVRLQPGSTSPTGDDHLATIRIGTADEGAVATFSQGFSSQVVLNKLTRRGGLMAAQLAAVLFQ